MGVEDEFPVEELLVKIDATAKARKKTGKPEAPAPASGALGVDPFEELLGEIGRDAESAKNKSASDALAGAAPDWVDEILAEKAAKKAAERAAQLLASSQPYMARKHLLPPQREFSNVDEYVSLLTALGQAVAAGVRLHLFEPGPAQRRGNARAVTEWKAAQYRAQSQGSPRAIALGALRSEAEIVATTPIGGRSPLARTAAKIGGGNDQLNVSAYTLGAFVNDGGLTETEVTQALMDAAHTWSIPADDDDCRRTIESGLSSAAGDRITRR